MFLRYQCVIITLTSVLQQDVETRGLNDLYPKYLYLLASNPNYIFLSFHHIQNLLLPFLVACSRSPITINNKLTGNIRLIGEHTPNQGRYIKQVIASGNMLPENEALFQKFYREKDAQKSPELMKLDSSILRRFEEHVNKPMLQVTKDDVVNYFYNMKLGAYSIEIHKMQIKKFFKWLYNFDETQKVPEQVSWYKSNRAKAYKHKTKAEIPTKEEVQLILDSCSNILERCVVSVLYDSAARLGEFCKLKVGDVVQKDGEYCICVSGKTGQRTIPLNFSLKYLLEYLDAHPMRNDPKALLWLSRRGEGYTKFGMSALIKAIIARSGIQKRTTAHMLRHSRLTELTHVGLVESETRVFAGWTPESNMPSIYLHINSDDMLQAVRRVEPKVNYVDKEKMETENLTQLEQRMEQKMKEMEDRYIQKILELQHPDLEKQPIEVQEKVVQDTHELQDYLNLVADTEPEQ